MHIALAAPVAAADERTRAAARVLLLQPAREEIARLDARLAAVVAGYLRVLARNPTCGPLERHGRFRRLYVDRDHEPARMWPPVARVRDADGYGARWRVCYRIEQTKSAGMVIVVLAVGLGHAGRGAKDAYALAEARLEAMLARRAVPT